MFFVDVMERDPGPFMVSVPSMLTALVPAVEFVIELSPMSVMERS